MAEMDPLIHSNSQIGIKTYYEEYIQPVYAEFLGVCLFVFVGVLSPLSEGTDGNLIGVAVGHGLTIALLIMALGNISGGHFNPAVTFGVALSGNIKPLLAVAYVIGQLLGGLLGAAFVRAILPANTYSMMNGAQTLPPVIEPGWAVLCEGILTFILVFTVLMTAVDNRTKSKLAPLAIGFAVAVDILAGGRVTGASMNPARTFGPAVVASPLVDGLWTYHYVYWVGPLGGAFLAAINYRLLFASPDLRIG